MNFRYCIFSHIFAFLIFSYFSHFISYVSIFSTMFFSSNLIFVFFSSNESQPLAYMLPITSKNANWHPSNAFFFFMFKYMLFKNSHSVLTKILICYLYYNILVTLKYYYTSSWSYQSCYTLVISKFYLQKGLLYSMHFHFLIFLVSFSKFVLLLFTLPSYRASFLLIS